MSTVIGIVMQYYATGWGGLVRATAGKQATGDKRLKRYIASQEIPQKPSSVEAVVVEEPSSGQEGETDYGESGVQRQERGGGYPKGTRYIKRHPRGGKRQRPK